jgi:Family of unknown function (DUF5681)
MKIAVLAWGSLVWNRRDLAVAGNRLARACLSRLAGVCSIGWQLGARMLEKTDTKQGPRFRKGQSGNPSGRPRGARNKATLAVEALLDGEAEALTRKAIERALEGDTTALRLCLDRLLPPRKDRLVSFAMPLIENADGAARLMAAILAAVAAGELTPTEASEIARLVEVFAKTLEMSEFEARLVALEQAEEKTR